MKAKEKIIIITLVAAGCLFLLLAYFSDNSSSTLDYSALYQVKSEQVDFPSLKSGMAQLKGEENPFLVTTLDSLEGKTALYLIPAKACSSCMNEVEEYVELIEELNKQGLNIKQVAWFHGQNTTYVKQFAAVTNFPVKKGYSLSATIPTPLLDFKDGIDDQQLIFINNSEGEIFFRIKLPTGAGTDLQTKKAISDQVFPGSLVSLKP